MRPPLLLMSAGGCTRSSRASLEHPHQLSDRRIPLRQVGRKQHDLTVDRRHQQHGECSPVDLRNVEDPGSPGDPAFADAGDGFAK